MNAIVAILETILGEQAIQDPAATYVATFLKAKLPAGFEPDVKAFLALVASKL